MYSVEFIFQSRKFSFLVRDAEKEYNHKLHKVIPGKPVIIFCCCFAAVCNNICKYFK